MTVSIIVTLYDRPKLMLETMDSITRQTYKDVEVIAIDASTNDDVEDVFWRSYLKADYFRIENKGISNARNYGAKLACGDAFIFLDDDNILSPTYVEKTVPLLTMGIGIVSTAMRVFSPNEESLVPAKVMTVDQLKNDNQIHISSLVARDAFEQAGGFKEDVYEDWELWLHILKLGWQMKVVTEPLFHYRSNEPSLITRHKGRHAERIANMQRMHADIYQGNR